VSGCKFLYVAILLAVAATWTARAQADASWVVRPLVGNVGGTISGADIMVSPSGDVVAGYSLYTNPGAGGAVTLARLDGKLFDYSSFSLPANSPSFAMDKFANVYYASNQPGGSANQFGYNLLGTMADATVSLGNYELVNSSLALDNNGIPTIVGAAGIVAASPVDAAISTFDTHSGTWQTSLLGGPAPYANTACFDANNGAAVASLSPSQLTLFRQDQGVWQNQGLATDVASGGLASIAASPGGEIEFAYPRQDGGIGFGTADGAFVNKGLLSLPAGQSLAYHSLAVDPQGNPALVYGNALTHQLYFARSNAQGVWSAQLLPVSADWGNLTFDAAGDPYICAVLDAPGSYRLELLSPALPFLAPGDTNGDGVLNSLDIDAIYQHLTVAPPGYANWPRPLAAYNVQYDVNGDGVVSQADVTYELNHYFHTNYGDANLDKATDFVDFQTMLNHWQRYGAGIGWAQADFNGDGVVDFLDFQMLLNYWNPAGWNFAPSQVPEPASLTLVLLCGLALLRRKK
jgi:hypothetical protein